MRKWSRMHIVSEVALLLVPALATAILLFVDLRGLRQDTDWRWWALAAFSVFVLVVTIDLARLVIRINALEEQRASLAVRHKPDQHPYWMDKFGYRIGIFNLGPTTADHVEVMLNDIRPLPQMEQNVLPSRLGHKDGYCCAEYCEINAQSEHYFDVLNRRGVVEWGLTTIAGTRLQFMNDTTYIFDLTVSARNLESDPLTVQLKVRPKGQGDWLAVAIAEPGALEADAG